MFKYSSSSLQGPYVLMYRNGSQLVASLINAARRRIDKIIIKYVTNITLRLARYNTRIITILLVKSFEKKKQNSILSTCKVVWMNHAVPWSTIRIIGDVISSTVKKYHTPSYHVDTCPLSNKNGEHYSFSPVEVVRR